MLAELFILDARSYRDDNILRVRNLHQLRLQITPRLGKQEQHIHSCRVQRQAPLP